MTQGQKCRATEEQLAALDAELAAHGIRPEDPRHPLAGRPQNALEDAMITGLELAESADRAGFLATFCKVEKRTARTWLKDSREMSRNAVAIVLDVLAGALYESPDVNGPYAAEVHEAITDEEISLEYGFADSSADERCHGLAFELLFMGMAEADRQKVLTLEALHAVLLLSDEQTEAVLGALRAFDSSDSYGPVRGIEEADPEQRKQVANAYASDVLREAKRLGEWAERRMEAPTPGLPGQAGIPF